MLQSCDIDVTDCCNEEKLRTIGKSEVAVTKYALKHLLVSHNYNENSDIPGPQLDNSISTSNI